jgi:Cu(I)/Ag(I) efflux system membrane fusion protein
MIVHRSSSRGAGKAPLIAALAVATLAAAAGYWFGARSGAPGTAAMPPVTPAAPVPGERKVLYWHDPMVPGHRFDKPGKSPFMDMDLVPVYADAGTDAGGIAISPRLTQSLGIRTADVREATLDTGFVAVGAVGVDERAIVAVQSRAPGYVERLHVRAQYDAVAAGSPLADLYVPEWLAGEEELLALKRSARPGAAGLVDAARQRLRLLGVPDAEITRVERDGTPSARVTLAAPVGGIVWEIGARDGMAVMVGTTLFRIAGIGTVWVTADVPEAQAALVRVGAPVEARAAGYPERSFKGTVNAFLPEVSAATRTVRARIVLANPGGALKPGMYTTVAFGGAAPKPSVVVPTEAVIRSGKRDVVIVDAGEGRFEPVAVEVGRESGDLVEIRSGLSVGERIVVSGQFLVDSEANLKGALTRLAAAGEARASAVDPHAAHAAPAAPAAPAHQAQGVVRAIGPDVLIKHGAIPSANMGPMTMAYKAPPGGLPQGIKEGMSVRFTFVLTPEGDMMLTSIAPAPPEGAK